MSELDIFAAIILTAIVLAVLVVVIRVLGALPWRFARIRNHLGVEAVAGSAWLSLLCGGVLWLLALAWFLHSTARVQSTTSDTPPSAPFSVNVTGHMNS